MLNNKVVVYTSGTFDLLHSNHIKMFEYARSLGDILIVGVNTDEVVKSYKSSLILSYEERVSVVKSIRYVDIAVPQKSLDLSKIVKDLNIDVFVVGSDWAGKYDYLRKQGINVFYFPYGDGVSSTNIKQKVCRISFKLK